MAENYMSKMSEVMMTVLVQDLTAKDNSS